MSLVVPKWFREVVESYQQDGKIKELLKRLTLGANEANGYTLVDGMLTYQGKIVIWNNAELKKKIMQALHESPLRGHSGVHNTYLWIRQLFHWPRVKTEVTGFVQACDTYKRCKSETVAYPGLLQPLPIPNQAWSSVSMDFVEGLTKSEGKDGILVVVD